jgi:hypothetical protein
MTSEQRGAHIQKRKERAIKARIKPQSKYVFSNRKSRPALERMSGLQRRSYLKNLIKFAALNSSACHVVPFDKQKFAELSLAKVKAALRAGKKTRKKSSVYKDLTYTSLIPKCAVLTTDLLVC